VPEGCEFLLRRNLVLSCGVEHALAIGVNAGDAGCTMSSNA
jgi:hypothetical protein